MVLILEILNMENFESDEVYLRDFFEHAPIGFHAFGPNRFIIDINETELKMLGYIKEEVVGKKTWADLIIPREVPLFERHWQDITTTGEVRNLRYTIICKDGQKKKVLLNASARFDSNRRLINTRGSVVDITAYSQTARMLASSQKKLKRHIDSLEENNSILFNIQKNMEDTIFPLVEKLKRRGSSLDKRNLMLLEKYLQDLTRGLAIKVMNKKWQLSAREIEICRMVKHGLTTKDIADLLCTSMRTIEHHRNHIRKKLGISKSSTALAALLKGFSV